MYSMFLATLLSMPNPNCPFGAACATSHNGAPATVTITISATIVSASELSMDVQQLEVKEAYAVNLQGITTGVPDAATVSDRYLVIDGQPSNEQPLVFSLLDGRITVSDNPRDVFVMNIPHGIDMPKGRELVAMVDAVMMVKNPMAWLAANRAKSKSKKAVSRQ